MASINSSGHKYGLVYPGVGWVVWRDASELPEDLVFKVNYLGGEMPTFALNFSRSGANVAAQYYNFLRLGYEGYRQVQQACQDVALHLSGKIAQLGPFELLTDGSDLPVFAFRVSDKQAGFTVFDLSERLRSRGWLVPAYTFPANLQDVAVLRIVVRNGFSKDLADVLLVRPAAPRQGAEQASGQPHPAGPEGQARVFRALISPPGSRAGEAGRAAGGSRRADVRREAASGGSRGSSPRN